eukprot:CAMPEP_0198728476 /NCGR_PEP_ID=MMETSP1475-20131203/9820_1 /TAXON_ID= ORGANISM="Unidentified sp., Strain CCMP1999" /NCGR_SAMPLE_ID=MMETSP1475 /ASSEMBLY_ACC=CAM_ASM_001111 /LENGTH=179 /DNA_ID=CAMNT_0044490861 /DNA_START=72 /DNA_END=611 /DNA_ORIENTATION=+
MTLAVERFSTRAETPDGRCFFVREEPILMRGFVVAGFGRGGKMLGCPTANIPPEPYVETVDKLPGGIYFGWAALDKCEAAPQGDLCKMVMSIGWNPYFKNEKKSVEAHLIKTYPADFYGVELRLLVVGFLRLEANFESLEALKEAIQSDISLSSEALDCSDLNAFRKHEFLAVDGSSSC